MHSIHKMYVDESLIKVLIKTRRCITEFINSFLSLYMYQLIQFEHIQSEHFPATLQKFCSD